VIGALIRDIVRRHGGLVVIGGVIAAAVIWSWTAWPLPVWSVVWAAVLCGLILLAARHDLGDGAE
jgi:uncharacterized membrane protein YccC